MKRKKNVDFFPEKKFDSGPEGTLFLDPVNTLSVPSLFHSRFSFVVPLHFDFLLILIYCTLPLTLQQVRILYRGAVAPIDNEEDVAYFALERIARWG